MEVSVCTETSLANLLEAIVATPINPPVLDPPSLYLDVQGPRPGLSGSISAVSIYLLPKQTTYTVDVAQLGPAAFTTPSRTEHTLRSILESPAYPKAVFDVRKAAAPLDRHGVRLAGARDVQLLELATHWQQAAASGEQHHPKRRVSSFRGCVEGDVPARAEGRWGETALGPACLADLYPLYLARLADTPFWRMLVADATRARVRDALADRYDPRAPGTADAPWDRAEVQEKMEKWAGGKPECRLEIGFGVFDWKEESAKDT